MKILQVNASYKPAAIYGGPTMSVAQLSENLGRAGVMVDVFTTTANGSKELDIARNRPVNVDGVRVFYFSRMTGDHSHFSPRLLLKLWREAATYDVIHIHAWWNLVSVFSAMIAHIRKVPVLISPRGTLSDYSFNNKKAFIKNRIHAWIGKDLLTRSYMHVTSIAEGKALKEIIAPQEIFNLPNFVKFTIADGPGIREDNRLFRMIFLSRVEEKKGLDILLNALSLIKYPWHLTIAGSGSEKYVEELRKIAENNKVSHKISWIGFQGDDKFELLRKHDLLVLPSYNENFGNVVIESLAMGTAVLLSKYVGLADYVVENDLGWVCDTVVSSVGENINNIIANRGEDLLRIRTNAPPKIIADFNEDILTQAYINVYKQIIRHE